MNNPMNTPWGPAQDVEPIAPGIDFISTASHGGFKLDAERNAEVPDYLRAASFNSQGERGWYEEDCDAAIVAVVFGERYPESFNSVEAAQEKLRYWKPEALVRWLEEGRV